MSGTQRRNVKLLFLDLVAKFNPRKGDSCVIKALEPQHWSRSLFHATMILFYEVIEIFAGSHFKFHR